MSPTAKLSYATHRTASMSTARHLLCIYPYTTLTSHHRLHACSTPFTYASFHGFHVLLCACALPPPLTRQNRPRHHGVGYLGGAQLQMVVWIQDGYSRRELPTFVENYSLYQTCFVGHCLAWQRVFFEGCSLVEFICPTCCLLVSYNTKQIIHNVS